MSSRNSFKELITYNMTISTSRDNIVNSKDVSFPFNKQIELKLSHVPIGIWMDNNVILNVCLSKTNKDPLHLRYRVSFLNANGDKCETQERVATLSKQPNRERDIVYFKRDYLMNTTNGCLVNGNLTAYWEVEEVDTSDGSSAQANFDRLSQDYKSLLESGNMSDAVLVVGKKELPVHKLIISTRSPVFAAMFAHSNTKEAQENRVVITDVDVEVLEQLLKYIYTGTVESLDKFAMDLLVAADKYQLVSLKAICEQFLGAMITAESVSDSLLFADFHQATELISKCYDFIADNGIQVMITEGWKKILAKPNLMSKAMERMSHKFSDFKQASNKNK